jgi:Mg-chelatase subunit ChlD
MESGVANSVGKADGLTAGSWDEMLLEPARCQLDVLHEFDRQTGLSFSSRSDVILAIDVSMSTRGVTPARGKGLAPEKWLSVAPRETVLAAEIGVACSLVRGAGTADVRFGVVSFSGDLDRTAVTLVSDAESILAPTASRAAVESALNKVLWAGPDGGTNHEAALLASLAQLGDRSRHRRIILITDGLPSLPHASPAVSDVEDLEAVYEAAERVALEGARLDVVAIGIVARSSGTMNVFGSIAALGNGQAHPFYDPFLGTD